MMDVKGAEKDTVNVFMDGPFLQWVSNGKNYRVFHFLSSMG